MELKLFAEKINLYTALEAKDEHTRVVVPTEDPSVGAKSCVEIDMVYGGFDWDTGKIFLSTKEPVIKAYKSNGLSHFEYEFLKAAIANGYKYICRHPNGNVIISKSIPQRTPRGWSYDKKNSEVTSLFKHSLKKLTWENDGVNSISAILKIGG